MVHDDDDGHTTYWLLLLSNIWAAWLRVIGAVTIGSSRMGCDAVGDVIIDELRMKGSLALSSPFRRMR